VLRAFFVSNGKRSVCCSTNAFCPEILLVWWDVKNGPFQRVSV
jgi:hypothetical protein